MLALRPATAKGNSQQPDKHAQPQEKPSNSQPQINNSHTPVTVSANILPCRIHHDGPIEVSSRHWNPVFDAATEEKPRTSTVYFRGRKLRGRSVPLPGKYHGVVVTRQPQCEDPVQLVVGDHDDDEAEEKEEPISQLETVGMFSTIMVWEHEKVPTDEDVYVRSMEEWISFAHAMHDDGARTEPLKN
ncbi:hypothetical protein MaudCBS49596_007309 [Microsporum audouinii]